MPGSGVRVPHNPLKEFVIRSVPNLVFCSGPYTKQCLYLEWDNENSHSNGNCNCIFRHYGLQAHLMNTKPASTKYRTYLQSLIMRASFNGGLLSLAFNPNHIMRRYLQKSITKNSGSIVGNTLDFGCGLFPYAKLLTQATRIIGLELQGKDKITTDDCIVYYSGDKFPFLDDYFDSVVSFEVFEHLTNPINALDEIYRVVKKNGYVIITTPFLYPLHEIPYDYRRLTKYELSRLLEAHSFELVKIQHGPSSFLTIKQLQVLHYTNKSARTIKSIRISLVLVPIINILALSLNWMHRNNSDIYLSNFILARKRGDN
jgi:SAM-dependent methyltransferase